jgi:transcriptional regulator with XRE-family HTH domain
MLAVPRPTILEAVIFGKTVRRLREELGLSQQKVAEAANLSLNFVSDIERGVKSVTLATILKLAHALDCPPSELLADFSAASIRRVLRGTSG